MKHVDSLNIKVTIGTVGVVSPPAPPASFDCLQFDLGTVMDKIAAEADVA